MSILYSWALLRVLQDSENIDSEGWMTIPALRAALSNGFSEDEIAEMARIDSRYQLDAEERRVRALYGHSVPIEFAAAVPPERLWCTMPWFRAYAAKYDGLGLTAESIGHLVEVPPKIEGAATITIDTTLCSYKWSNPAPGVWLYGAVIPPAAIDWNPADEPRPTDGQDEPPDW